MRQTGRSAKSFFSRDLPSVYINGIAQSLKGVKGDANRQQNIKGWPVQDNTGMRTQCVEILKDKIKIFKEE